VFTPKLWNATAPVPMASPSARPSSKEQEREADYLAAVILYRSGVDLDKARGNAPDRSYQVMRTPAVRAWPLSCPEMSPS
jgi:hypothetical protein